MPRQTATDVVPGRLLVLGGEHDAPHLWSRPGADVALFSRRGPDKNENEDGLFVCDLGQGWFVLAVVDGMGGLPDGELAARLTLEAFERALADRSHPTDPACIEEAVVEGFERANRAVLDDARGAGATLVAAIVGPRSVQVVHAGDAEALLVGQRGRVKLRTIAHSPTGFALADGSMPELAALVHPERHLVTNAIGMPPVTVEVGPVLRLAARDTLVLASDGLFDNLTQNEIADGVRCGPLLVAAARTVNVVRGRMLDSLRFEAQSPAPIPSGPTFPCPPEPSGDPSSSSLLGKPDDLSLLLLRRNRRSGAR